MLKLMASAPWLRAASSREGTWSMAKMRPASEVLRAGNRHHADGTTAEDRDRVAGMDVGHFRCLVRGGQNVAHHDGLIVRDLLGELDEVGGGIGHARVLGLKAIETAGCFRAAEEDGAARGPAGLMTLHWA